MLKYWDTKKSTIFTVGTNEKLMVLGVPLLQQFRVFYAPNFGEVEGGYWFGPVRPSVHNTFAAEKLKNRLC